MKRARRTFLYVRAKTSAGDRHRWRPILCKDRQRKTIPVLRAIFGKRGDLEYRDLDSRESARFRVVLCLVPCTCHIYAVKI